MTLRMLSNSIFCVVFCSFCFAGSTVQAQSRELMPPDSTLAGMSQEDWSRAWWQWAGSFSRRESPVADRTGELCAAKQKGPVWFLAGTYGTQRTVRTCTVPAGKYLFFPLINYVIMPTSAGSITCAEAIASARTITDSPGILILDVDGVPVRDLSIFRQATRECFDMGALTDRKFSVFPSAANGYYVMLRPLSPGTHVINFGGALPGMLQAVTYTLLVE
jgi:hypothetical protein